MSPEAERENRACETVVAEFRIALAQLDAPEPALHLCLEIEARIALRRLLRSDARPIAPDRSARP